MRRLELVWQAKARRRRRGGWSVIGNQGEKSSHDANSRVPTDLRQPIEVKASRRHLDRENPGCPRSAARRRESAADDSETTKGKKD
jgi:hypothetical protein